MCRLRPGKPHLVGALRPPGASSGCHLRPKQTHVRNRVPNTDGPALGSGPGGVFHIQEAETARCDSVGVERAQPWVRLSSAPLGSARPPPPRASCRNSDVKSDGNKRRHFLSGRLLRPFKIKFKPDATGLRSVPAAGQLTQSADPGSEKLQKRRLLGTKTVYLESLNVVKHQIKEI